MKINQERKYDAVDGKIVNRATGKPIPDDEPIIIFRAKDSRAVNAMIEYMELCTDPTHKEVIQGRIGEFHEWQNKNQNKVCEPDSDASCLKTSDTP